MSPNRRAHSQRTSIQTLGAAWIQPIRCHPGQCAETHAGLTGTKIYWKHIAASKEAATLKYETVPQGAATTVWASFVAPADAVGGYYCEDGRVCEVNDDAGSRAGARSYALNPTPAEELWSKERGDGRRALPNPQFNEFRV
jgi:hypothetical protein